MLTPREVQEFREQGFFVCNGNTNIADELPTLENSRRVFDESGPWGDPEADRHLDDPLTYQLCSMPQIVGRVASLLGPDVLLWHSRYFNKTPGAPPVPWHQDAPFWPMQPKRCISAWLALEDVYEGNGCVRALPGSHKKILPRISSEGTGRFGKKADISGVDVKNAVPLVLRRGDFYLFHGGLLHCSGVNLDTESRIGLSIQFIPPEVQLGVDRLRKKNPRFGVLQVSGEDPHGHNPHTTAPE